MSTTYQPLPTFSQPVVGLGLKFMAISLDCAEKIVHFNLALGRAGMDTCALSMKELTVAASPEETMSKISKISSDASSKVMHCSSELCNDLSKSHEDLCALTEHHFSALRSVLSDLPAADGSKKKTVSTAL
ncbi:hypothetical protein [Aquitalea aquatilis]|uniref:hypothetical protein n=1 Tax=Aquitalea aquatilis TaxID=1537400 RepID=UPI0010BDC228|nr:hypothetical protein [Aquitalea aquatilis]